MYRTHSQRASWPLFRERYFPNSHVDAELQAPEAFCGTIVNSVLGTLSVAISLIALVYGMVAQYKSSPWHYNQSTTPNGKYTVEGWTCQVKDVMIEREDEFATVCRESVSSV
jgi:hypothetical protein